MKRIFVLGAMLVLMFAVGSCSSSGGGDTPTDPGGAISDAQLGDEALASGDYAAANQHYKNALAKDPNNAQANFGAALSEMILVSEDPEVVEVAQLADGVELPPGFPARTPGNDRIGLSRARATLERVGLVANVSAHPMSYGKLVGKALMLGAGEPEVLSDIQFVIKFHVLPPLQYVEDRLLVLEAHPDFVFKITPEMSGMSDTLEVDLGEVYVIDALVNAIQGWLHLMIAYNFDAPEGARADSLLAAGTQFASLHPGGGLDLAAAHANMLLSHARIEAMIAYVNAETDPQDDDVIPQAAVQDPEFMAFKEGFDDLKEALTMPVIVDVEDYLGNPALVTMQIGNFFDTPISDWKTKLPNHTFSTDGMDVFPTDPVTFPDPKFNDVFPEMTNAAWQTLLGPVGPTL